MGMSIAAMLMTGAILLWLELSRSAPVWQRGVFGVLLGLGVYSIASYALKVPEAREFGRILIARDRSITG